MKKPTSENSSEESVYPSQSSIGAMARVRRFFSLSSSPKRSSPSHQDQPPEAQSYQLLKNLKVEADKIISRPLDEIIHQQEDQPHGVPILIHNLCLQMTNNGADMNTLISDNWTATDIRNWLNEIDDGTPNRYLDIADDGALGPSKVAGLLRLFIAEMPHPLLTKPVAISISRIYDGQPARSQTMPIDLKTRGLAIRELLAARLPENNLKLLVYLVSFLNKLHISHSNFGVSDISRVIGRNLCDLDQTNGAFRLAHYLLDDYDVIFSEPIVPLDDGDYNSDSVSSTGDSRSDFTDGDQLEDTNDKSPDEDSTTSSDADEFRSFPVSPMKAWSSSSSKSTREAPEICGQKIPINISKNTIRSITDLLSSPEDSSRDEGFKIGHLDDSPYSLDNYASAGEESDGLESETARDADLSDTEGRDDINDERRFSDYSKNRKTSTGTKSRRKVRRKNSKDLGTRQMAIEGDNNGNSSDSASDEEPRTDQASSGFRDLLASNEPVTSDMAAWSSRKYDIDDTHRTAPIYSRFEDESANKGSWYQELDSTNENFNVRDSNDSSSNPAVKVLMRSINSVKKQIRKFEKEFETNYGYKPSHSDKMKDSQIKDLMTEMKEMRKELKQLKDDVTGFIMPKSSRRQTNTPSVQLMRQIEESLRQKRYKAHRPQEVPAMAAEDLRNEKANLQEALLYYERSCGRPVTHEDKTTAKHLYKRYRAVKQRLSAGDASPELIPIVENVETVFLETASPLHRGSLQTEEDIKIHEDILRTLPMNRDPHPDTVPGDNSHLNLADLHSLPAHELRERKKIAKENKKTLKRALRKYEMNFENRTGRKVSKDDRGPMEKVYTEYKLAKAKLKLLDALLAKDEQRRV